jgi:hypothetical protein
MNPPHTLIPDVAKLLRDTGEAHHQAFIETNGEDPEWAIWYADYLQEKLAKLVRANFTRSDLIYLLVKLEKTRALDAPGSDWAYFYARLLVRNYTV